MQGHEDGELVLAKGRHRAQPRSKALNPVALGL